MVVHQGTAQSEANPPENNLKASFLGGDKEALIEDARVRVVKST